MANKLLKHSGFHRSDVTDSRRVKKSAMLLRLRRPLPITGDVCLEFFNKPKMMKKVSWFLQGLYKWGLLNVNVAEKRR